MASTKHSCLCLLALVLAASSVVAQPPVNPPPYIIKNSGALVTLKVGCILPFTGVAAARGKASWNGAKLAIKDMATALPVFNFELICYDTQCSNTYSPGAVEELNFFSVIGILGDQCSSASINATAALAGTVLISGTATSDVLSDPAYNTFFRTVTPDRFQGPVLAKLVAGKTPTVKVGLAASPDAYGTGLAANFKKAFQALPGTNGAIVVELSILPDNVLTVVAEMKAKGVKKAVLPTTNTTWLAEFLVEAKKAGISPAIFAGDAAADPSIPQKIKDLKPVGAKASLIAKLTVTSFSLGAQSFKNKYAKEFTDDYAGGAAHFYDAGVALIRGYVHDLVLTAAQGAPQPAKVSTAGVQKQTFQGASGYIQFDAVGDLVATDTSYEGLKFKANKLAPVGFLPLP